MFDLIKAYHVKLGYRYENATLEQRMNALRDNALGLNQEVAELVDSMPWKPWRNVDDQPIDHDNALREVVDCIFFLVGMCECMNISGGDVDHRFMHVLNNNLNRITDGYSNTPDERG